MLAEKMLRKALARVARKMIDERDERIAQLEKENNWLRTALGAGDEKNPLLPSIGDKGD